MTKKKKKLTEDEKELSSLCPNDYEISSELKKFKGMGNGEKLSEKDRKELFNKFNPEGSDIFREFNLN